MFRTHLSRSRALRHDATPHEQRLWRLLRNKQLSASKFRRQHVIGEYIVDFYCPQYQLVIELDGGGHTEHNQQQHDCTRDEYLSGVGCTILRFWNSDLDQNCEGVLLKIMETIEKLSAPPHPTLSPKGEENHLASLLDTLPTTSDILRKGDDRISAYRSDTMLTGNPDAVVRPGTTKECAEILSYCHAQRIPVTVCGSRTSMTGSSVAESGLVLSIEKMNTVRDVGVWHGRPVAIAGPGIILGEFQRAVDAAHFFYPPSPTSRNEAMLGATIATNATGDNTYKYGPTRRYVRELTVLLSDGSERIIRRPDDHVVTEQKNTAGYYLHGDEIDYFIGSEGTLGLITEVTVDLLSQPHPQFGLFIFFPTNTSALDAIVAIDADARVRPSALEFVDGNALAIMATHPEFPGVPDGAGAALIVYQEYAEEMRDPLMNAWFEILSAQHPQMAALLDHTIVSTQPADEARLRAWRHHIPARVNELGQQFSRESGGGKVGSDWWVPLPRMRAMMDFMYVRSEQLHIPFLAFAHLGNGHPHVNYLCRTPDEIARAKSVLIECCHQAVRLGGGVAGEHGLGKLKRDLLAIQYPSAMIEKMYALKNHYDPHWILGRGNILPVPPGL